MDINQTPPDPDALLSLVERVKENYQEPPPAPPKRGKKREFSALSFLLLAVVAVTMRTFRDSELCKLLEKDQRLRQAMGFPRVPHRTCIGRRLAGLVPEAEQQIALLGQLIVDEVRPAADQAVVSAIDAPDVQSSRPALAQEGPGEGARARQAAQCRHRIELVKERLSRLGAGLSAPLARTGLPGTDADRRLLASEQ